MTTDSRLHTLRALLAQHEQTPSDARCGHTYRWPEPDPKVQMKTRTRRAKRIAAKLLPMVGWSDRPGTVCEAIEIAHPKGRKRWNGGGGFGFWVAPIVKAQTGLRCHPTQKPESLIAGLVADFTDESETILDPFMGSGTTLVAAKRLGRKAIGIEREEKYCEIAAKRLQQEALPLEMGT